MTFGHLDFQFVHAGYYRAESNLTGDAYVIRTRPLNDGWMSIAESDSTVMATKQSVRAAMQTCLEVDLRLHSNPHRTY